MTEEERGFWTLDLGNRQRYIASTSTKAATTVPGLDLEPVMRRGDCVAKEQRAQRGFEEPPSAGARVRESSSMAMKIIMSGGTIFTSSTTSTTVMFAAYAICRREIQP